MRARAWARSRTHMWIHCFRLLYFRRPPTLLPHYIYTHHNNIWNWNLQHLRSYQDRYRLGHWYLCWLYSTTPLGSQVAGTMTQHPIQSHYPDTELTSPCPILLISSTRLGSDKYQCNKSLVWLDREPNSWPSAGEARAVLIRLRSPVSQQTKSEPTLIAMLIT